MFNSDAKKNAIVYVHQVAANYEKQAERTQEQAIDLFELRKDTSAQTIFAVERFINRLANTPKQYIKTVSEYRIEVDRFDQLVEQLQVEAAKVPVQTGTRAAIAVGTGAAVVAFAPTAALAVATTFGTASTGAAISALSGAAATNAALAWLGGGALVAGGGGIAAGEALLVLAGPVGWAIGGLALAVTGLWASNKNAKIAEEATRQGERIEGKAKALVAAQREIKGLMTATRTNAAGIGEQLAWLSGNSPADYQSFSNEQRYHLGALINNVESLSALLNKKIA